MNVLLTGVSKGLGLEIAELLLENGNAVYGLSRSKTLELQELQKKYENNFHWISYDLENVDGIQKEIFKNWIGYNTPIHAYINNAALAYDDIVTNISLEPLEKMFKVNVYSPMIMTKYTIRQMLLHNLSGSVVHLSSISVHTGYKGLSMYAATKGALEAFSKNTAREWGEKNIRSNALVAGFMETEMSSTLSDDQKKRIHNRTSLKKPVSVNSVAETVLFLVDEKSKSITGQNIHVDNGTI